MPGAHFTGDAFTSRYNEVIPDLPQKKKCVDDVCGLATNISQVFQDAKEFLTLTGNNGIVHNPKKFVFGQEELKVVGFWLGKEGVRPTE